MLRFQKAILFLFLSISLNCLGQGVSVLPTHLPTSIYGTWANSKNEVVLILFQDYVIVQNEIYSYNTIVLDQNQLDITCVINNDKVKYISLLDINYPTILLDEGYKITKLNKLTSSPLTSIPKSLTDIWYTEKDKITLAENNVLFSDEFYTIDYISSSSNNNYHLVLYREGDYFLLYNTINENGHFLIANFSKPLLFQKATFFQKNKTAILVFLAVLVIILGYMLIRWNIHLTKKKEITKRLLVEMQLKSIRSQMNPHFLFNALSAIQNLINRGDNEKANHYLTEFSQLMRLTLDKSEKGLVPLSEEITSIQKYLEIEKLRFLFEYQILTAPNINTHETEIPAMLIQPMVENAILHGLSLKKDTKKLSIEFKIENEKFICLVTDNGIGINHTSTKTKKTLNRQKYGLKLAQDRIALINESYQTQAEIHLIDLSDLDAQKSGTQVKISMPLKY